MSGGAVVQVFALFRRTEELSTEVILLWSGDVSDCLARRR
jgi:hypothetical protein